MEHEVKAVYDEQTLARVLEAAYVLQEHNRVRDLNLELQVDQSRKQQQEGVLSPELSPTVSDGDLLPKDDYTRILAQIVETQHEIQVRQLDLESVMALVADRLTQITGASGAAVAIVEGKIACYRAGSGTSALPSGTKLPMEKALCFTCLRTGQVMRCGDVDPEFLLDAEECHRRGINSLIALPVYHDGQLVGAVELHFDKVNGFNDQDIHAAQLIAGLVTEALTRDAQLTWKKSVAAEHAIMLEALEKLKPNLAALSQTPAEEAETKEDAAAAPEPTFVCRKCGHALVDEEQFCGQCGAPRILDREPASMQSKVASLWQMQQMKHASPPPSNGAGRAAAEAPKDLDASEAPPCDTDSQTPTLNSDELLDRELARLLGGGVPDFSVTHEPDELEQAAGHPPVDTTSAEADTRVEGPVDIESPVDMEESKDFLIPGEATSETEEGDAVAATGALVKTAQDITWTSAAAARDFLERVAQAQRVNKLRHFWNARRGEIYLAVALLLMAIVIRWGIWSNHSGAAGHRRSDVKLSMFEKLLVNLGIAEAPDKPEPKGNPDTQVWVDLHTALYYCPGTDLYGKTPTGRFTSQKDAQLDQFEPAYRKACN